MTDERDIVGGLNDFAEHLEDVFEYEAERQILIAAAKALAAEQARREKAEAEALRMDRAREHFLRDRNSEYQLRQRAYAALRVTRGYVLRKGDEQSARDLKTIDAALETNVDAAWFNDMIAERTASATATEARVKRLEEVLEPFVGSSRTRRSQTVLSSVEVTVSIADIERARAALSRRTNSYG